MTNERARVRDALHVLAAATQALPDNTYLTEFSLRSEQARLVGFSPSAANLIKVLAETAPFRDPTFGAPVVHPDNGKLEMFTIRVMLDPTNGE
jgi:general secretion pathway protein L